MQLLENSGSWTTKAVVSLRTIDVAASITLEVEFVILLESSTFQIVQGLLFQKRKQSNLIPLTKLSVYIVVSFGISLAGCDFEHIANKEGKMSSWVPFFSIGGQFQPS